MALEGKEFSHYRILQLIGKEGIGEVYLIQDLRVQRQVAAKFIRMEDPKAASSALRIFWREAAAIARLDHPTILPLYDHGQEIIDDTFVAYLIMPYRSEGSLVAWLRKRARDQQTQQLTLKQIVHVVLQASQSLQYAHDHQIMHLDVKPANFLIRSRRALDDYPDLLLSDFGIARLATMTSHFSQHVSGTPAYMAPEQYNGQPMFASDQYALAIMAYELLIGNPPFRGAPMSVMFAHIHEQPPSVCTHNPLLPLAVDHVLQRALAKKPQERFSSIAAFAHAFQRAFQSVDEKTTLRVLRPSSATLMPQMSGTSTSTGDIPATLAISAQQAPIAAPVHEGMTPPLTVPADPVPSPPFVLPSYTPPKRRRPRPLVVLRTLLILMLLLGGILGIYGAITGRWPWDAAQQHFPLLRSVTWSGSQFVAVGDSGTILTSPDGHTWTAQHSGTSQYLSSIAWSGSQFVAAGWNSIILTSPDGRSWTTRYSGTSQYLSNITWSDSQFVVVGNSGTILTSPDGRSWTSQHAGTSQDLSGIVWSGFQFVAVGDSVTILTSPDGHTWTSQHAGTSQYLGSVAWSGSRFVAVGGDTILTSPNGRSWTPQYAGISQYLNAVIWSGSQFVAVGYGTILTSPDGHTWKPQYADTSQNITSVAWSGSQFVAVGNSVTILASPDGHTWRTV